MISLIKPIHDTLIVKPSLENELSAYKLLYQTAQKAYENQSSSIFWVLGLIVTFIVLVLGSQYIYNWRINTKELAKIQSNLQAQFQIELNNLRERQSQIAADLLNQIDTRNSEQTALYQSILKDNAEKYQEYKSDIKENISLTNELLKKEIQKNKESFDRRIGNIKLDLDNAIGYLWSLRGVEMNALRRFIMILETQIAGGKNIEYSLDDLLESLEKVEDKEIESALYLSLLDIQKQIAVKYPNQYDDKLSTVKAFCEEAKVYEYEFDKSGSYHFVDKGALKVEDQNPV